MCYAIPANILEIDGDDAKVDYGGVKKTVNVTLIEKPKVGDFVLIHAGFAIEKLDKKSAQESITTINEYIQAMERASSIMLSMSF